MLCTGHIVHLNPTKFLLIEIIFNFQENKLYGVVFCWLVVRGTLQILVAPRSPLWLPAFIILFSAILKISTFTFSIFNTFVQIKEQNACFFGECTVANSSKIQLFGAGGVSDLCVGRNKWKQFWIKIDLKSTSKSWLTRYYIHVTLFFTTSLFVNCRTIGEPAKH